MDVVVSKITTLLACFRSSCGSEDKCGDSETEQYPEFSSCHQAETMYKSLQDELKQATEKEEEEPAIGDGDHQFHLELDQVIPDDAISLSPSIESLEVDESR